MQYCWNHVVSICLFSCNSLKFVSFLIFSKCFIILASRWKSICILNISSPNIHLPVYIYCYFNKYHLKVLTWLDWSFDSLHVAFYLFLCTAKTRQNKVVIWYERMNIARTSTTMHVCIGNTHGLLPNVWENWNKLFSGFRCSRVHFVNYGVLYVFDYVAIVEMWFCMTKS